MNLIQYIYFSYHRVCTFECSIDYMWTKVAVLFANFSVYFVFLTAGTVKKEGHQCKFLCSKILHAISDKVWYDKSIGLTLGS